MFEGCWKYWDCVERKTESCILPVTLSWGLGMLGWFFVVLASFGVLGMGMGAIILFAVISSGFCLVGAVVAIIGIRSEFCKKESIYGPKAYDLQCEPYYQSSDGGDI